MFFQEYNHWVKGYSQTCFEEIYSDSFSKIKFQHVFMYPYTQEIFIKVLLCARHYTTL